MPIMDTGDRECLPLFEIIENGKCYVPEAQSLTFKGTMRKNIFLFLGFTDALVDKSIIGGAFKLWEIQI